MKTIFLAILSTVSLEIFAQEEKDTVMSRCPIFIIDTITSNNYFLEYQPSTIKVYRAKGRLTILIEQKDQFFTVFFDDKKLKNTKYKIVSNANNNNEAAAKYSFRSGGSASYVDVTSGTIETVFDKEKVLWHIKINGMLANMVGRSVSYYKVKADFYIR